MRPAATTALLGLVLIAVAALLDAEPLYVPGIASVLLAAGAAAWVSSCARGVTVERTIGARRAVEEEPVALEVIVRAGRWAPPTGRVEEPLLPEPVTLSPGRRETRVRINARFGRRGRRTLAAPQVVVRDPFGLATRVVHGTPDELLVLPRIEQVSFGAAGGEGVAPSPLRGRQFAAAEIDLDGLRPLRSGTPASRIFWPAIARGAEPMERRLRADSDTRPLIVLDPRAPTNAAQLDAAVRATASLCIHLAHRGGCAILLPGDRRPVVLEQTLAGWPHLHARLATVDAGQSPALAALGARRGPVLYIAARVMRRPPRALQHAPGGGRILVVPGTLAGRRAAFAVAGCTGYEITTRRASSALVA